MSFYLPRFAFLACLGLLAAARAAAQTTPPPGPPGGATQQPNGTAQPNSGSSSGIFGPPVGQPQQQTLQGRSQQIQQSAQQQQQPGAAPPARQARPAAGQPGAAGQAGGAPSTAGAGASGTTAEPAGATTPSAPVGGTAPLSAGTPASGPTGAARMVAVAPARLSLPEAITIGLENNLTTLLALEKAGEARGLRQQVRSFLLPNLSGSAYQQNRTLNLVAQGLSAGGGDGTTGGGAPGGGGTPGGSASPIPPFVGPFKTFDARLNFSQTLLNIAALRAYKSSSAAVQTADLTAQLAREQVATFVGLAYLTAQRSTLETAAARADLTLADGLRVLAVKQRDAGVANGIDVVRAEARTVQQRLRLVQAEASAEQSRLDLERAVGLPPGSATVLTDTLGANPTAAPPLDEALRQAQGARLETRIAEQTLAQRELDRRARAADRYPVINAAGDYGQSAVTPFKNDRATRTYGLTLSVPVFDGGYIGGRVKAASSQQRQAEWTLGNTRGQVEEDVRLALVSWRLAAEQVRASAEQLNLALRELALAVQRFQAGVADNTEVLQAQAGLANARALRVQALAQYGAARLNFAAATGTAQGFRL